MRLILKLIAGFVLLVSACSLPDTQDGETEPISPPAGTVVYVDCIDNTMSVPVDFTRSIQDLIADEVVEYTQEPPFAKYVRYVRILGAGDSFGVAGEVATVDIPAVSEEPQQTEEGNVFDSGSKQEAEEELAALQQEWSQSFESAQDEASTQSDLVRNADLGKDRGSDIRGCILKARELIDQEPDVKEANILVASDFKAVGPQQDISLLDLEGINVRAIYYCNEAATQCIERQEQIQADLETANAKEVVFLDTSQI
jgi:hypothetical protein